MPSAGRFDLVGHWLTEIFHVRLVRNELSKEVTPAETDLAKSPTCMRVARCSARAPVHLGCWVEVPARTGRPV